MLAVDLRQLRSGPVAWREQLPKPGALWADIAVRFVGPVSLRARAEFVRGGGVHVQGRLTGTVGLECRRCLADMEQGLDLPLDLWFGEEPMVSPDVGALYPLDSQGDQLDLKPALREELLLAVPAFPVCRPDCEGICARCGAQHGEKPCQCSARESDLRWDALRALR